MTFLKSLAESGDFFSIVPVYEPTQLKSARIFDDVVMAATAGCSCFLVNTGEGLLLLDALLPLDACRDNIAEAALEAGWDIRDLRRILITHGHYDHSGAAGRLSRETGAEVWFPEGEYQRWSSGEEIARTNGRIAEFGAAIPPVEADFVPSRLLRDGDRFTMGHTTVLCVRTPGHTPDCMSYILNVTEQGTSHMALMPGGTLPRRDRAARSQQLASLKRLGSLAESLGVDVELQNHHPLCCGKEKMELCRRRFAHVPNPFIIGREGVRSALRAYEEMCGGAR